MIKYTKRVANPRRGDFAWVHLCFIKYIYMSVVFGANLIEGVILVSDSRATQRSTRAVSDTATKIVPIRPFVAVGVTGNPAKASILLSGLQKKLLSLKIKWVLSKYIY